MWEEGNIRHLLHKEDTTQERMKICKNGMNIEKISLKLKNVMSTGKINGAFNMERMSKGILTLTDRTMKILKRKLPKPNEPASELLLHGPAQPVHSIIFESVD